MAKVTIEFDWDKFMQSDMLKAMPTQVAKRTENAHYITMCDYDEQSWVCGKVYDNLQDCYDYAKEQEEASDEYGNYHHYILKIDEDGTHHNIELSEINGSDNDID